MIKKTMYLLWILSIPNDIISHDEYWKNNIHTSYYSLLSRFMYGSSIDDIIPEILCKIDSALLENPNDIVEPQSQNCNICICDKEYLIDQISYNLTYGPTYQAFQQILYTHSYCIKYPVQLRQSSCDRLLHSVAISSYIILNEAYYQYPDAIKLFCLYHELQHHVYNDIANNHLEKIIDYTHRDIELKTKLMTHRQSLHNHIVRYVEYRADTQAMHAMQCPYCLQEVAIFYETIQGKHQKGMYNAQGYLHAWQFQPKINELLSEKKCCQHHNTTNQHINLSVIDESTMTERLIIVQE